VVFLPQLVRLHDRTRETKEIPNIGLLIISFMINRLNAFSPCPVVGLTLNG
jgi:hypothetical protein